MNLAIIPARSGSKGLKDKNIMPLNGKPLMAYSIDEAIKSECFDEVMVSTDSEEYARIAKERGAKVPFLRSEINSSDTASSWDMVKEVLIEYQKLGKMFDTITLLQPTSPLRIADDIKEAYKVFFEKNAQSVVSVCETEHSPLLCNVLKQDNSMDGFLDFERLATRRQDMPTYYRINGAIYIYRIDDYADIEFELYNQNSFAYIMPNERSVDIDSRLDFIVAETILNEIKGNAQ